MKMKSNFLLVCLLFICSISIAQNRVETIKASSNCITKEVKVDHFEGIRLIGSQDLVYTQNDQGKTSVEIYGSDNLVELIDIKVKNGILEVKFKNKYNISFNKAGRLQINVSSPTLTSASLKGSEDIILNSDITGNDLTLQLNGSGDIKATKDISISRNFNASLEGSGDITLQGNTTAETMNLSVRGAGDMETNTIQASQGNIDLQGSGDIDINGNCIINHLTISLKGSGDITAKGVDSKKVNASLEGAGTMELRGKAEQTALALRNSGNIKAEKLISEEVTAHLNGSGNIKCHAEKKLDAHIDGGSGTIGYKGDPSVSITDSRSSQKVRKL